MPGEQVQTTAVEEEQQEQKAEADKKDKKKRGWVCKLVLKCYCILHFCVLIEIRSESFSASLDMKSKVLLLPA